MFLGIFFAVALSASSPCLAPTPTCSEWISPSGQPSRVLVYRTFPLETKNENVRRAFVFVHGINRDADNHFRTALAAAFLDKALDDTLIVAPRFASRSGIQGNQAGNCGDTLAPDEANWICEAHRPDTWRSGGNAIGGSKPSSFDFMDEILRRLADRNLFPNLKTIVVAGHSAGGQFVVRYAMLNRVHDSLGIPIRYLVANPSSYAYVDKLRPTPNAFTSVPVAVQLTPQPLTPTSDPAFVVYSDPYNCEGYDTWPYGLEGRTGYGSSLTREQVRSQLVNRPVRYLLGEADVLPLGVFDTSCAAMAQGPTRLARGLAFHKYATEVLHADHHVVIVPFCSHSQRCIFTSDAALRLMFPE